MKPTPRHTGFSRRRFLRSIGAATVLSPFIPLLNASGQEATVAPKRLLLVFTPDGTSPAADWRPQGTETDFTFHEIHAPLEPHKSKIVVPWGLRMSSAGAGEAHAFGMAGMFTGSLLHEPHDGVDFDGGNGARTGWGSGPSVDQIVASAFGPNMPYQRSPDDPELEVPYRTLELGVQAGNPHSVARMIYRADREPLHPEDNLGSVFDRLFTNVLVGQDDPGALDRLRAEQTAVVDLVMQDLNRLRGRIGAQEVQKIDNHLEGLLAIQRRLTSAPSAATCVPPDAPPGGRLSYPEQVTNMIDMTVAAMACDLTRVASLQLSRGFSFIRHDWLGHSLEHHTMSHDTSANWDGQLAEVDRWYAEQFAYLLSALDSIPEGNGTMLDNMIVLWGRELGDTDHRMDPVPMMLAGGARGELQTGRALTFGSTTNRRDRLPHSALLVSVAQLMGLETESIGNVDPNSGGLPGLV